MRYFPSFLLFGIRQSWAIAVFDHQRFSFPFQGLDQRLTGVIPAQVVQKMLAHEPATETSVPISSEPEFGFRVPL